MPKPTSYVRPARPSAPSSNHRLDKKTITSMLRVDHAGESAAVAIYRAQAKVFSQGRDTQNIAEQMDHMGDEEQEHLDAFDELLIKHSAKPTLLLPLWSLASRALGTATALMGSKAAHCCTEAVEDVIEQHYAQQIIQTKGKDQALHDRFVQFRQDELEHRDFARSEGADQAPAYPLLRAVIQMGCRFAIKTCEKN